MHHNCVKPHMGPDVDTLTDRAGIKIEGPDKWLTLIQNAARWLVERVRDKDMSDNLSDS